MSEHAVRRFDDHPWRRALRAGWLAPALALFPLLALLLAGCGTQAGGWRMLSPAVAHVFSLAADPHIPSLVYAGADNGAVYRARADQTGLAAPGEGIPADAVVASLLPDPKIPGRIFAGTTMGLYRSDHYGDQWGAFGGGLPSDVAALALASTPDDSLILAGLENRGVYRSADDGATWSPASTGLPAKATVTALTWDPTGQRWWAGLQNATSHSLFSSADGQTWIPSDRGIPTKADINALASVKDSNGDAVRFAATSAGLYSISGDSQTWGKAPGALPSGAALAVTAIASQPGAVVAAIGSSVYYSANTGGSWSPVAQGLTNPVQGLAVATDEHGAQVFYAASGQLARYPSGVPVSNPPSFLLIAAFALALVVGGYFIMRRSRRFGYAMGAHDNERTTGRAAEAARAWERQRGGGSTGGPSNAPPGSGVRSKSGDGATSRMLAPADLTTKEQTGAPADPDKASQNGHGDPRLRG